MGIAEILAVAASVSLLSGWRLYLAVLATGIAMRSGVVPLPEHLESLQVLANPWVMAVAGMAALAIAGGLYAGLWIGVLLSLGLLLLISASSMQILSQTEDMALERQVRWGILIVAAMGLMVYLNAFG